MFSNDFDLICEFIELVPKLEGSHNFSAWETACTSVLKSVNVWKFVSGDPPPPVRDPDEMLYVFEERFENFQANKGQALLIILCTCASHIQQSPAPIKTAKECWTKLHQTYGSTGPLNQCDLWHQFVKCTYQDESIENFCKRYCDIIDKFHTDCFDISPLIQALHFLRILQPHFPQWAANKREQMRREPKVLPQLHTLIQEITDEANYLKGRAAIEVAQRNTRVAFKTRSKR